MTSSFSALYYPSIEFTDPRWLWASSLLWDRIYRIVPKDYAPEDSDNVKRLCETGEIGTPIQPDNYATEVSNEFLGKLKSEHWSAAALNFDFDEEYERLHEDKVDVQLRKMIIAHGAKKMGDWLGVPKEFAAHYMNYLAKFMSEKNNLNLITDVSSAWTGATYFRFDGSIEAYVNDEIPSVLAALVVRDFVPSNVLNITPQALLSFREKYRDERHNFISAIQTAADRFKNCQDPQIVRDIYEDIKKDVEISIKNYKRSMDYLKVKTWTGLKTITFPVAAPVISQFIPLDPMQLTVLSSAGLAMGVVTGIESMKLSEKKLAKDKENEYSYLTKIEREWENLRHGGDLNYVLYRQIEEFIND